MTFDKGFIKVGGRGFEFYFHTNDPIFTFYVWKYRGWIGWYGFLKWYVDLRGMFLSNSNQIRKNSNG